MKSHCRRVHPSSRRTAVLIRRWGNFPTAAVAKNLPANAEDPREAGSIPGSRRSPGGGNGNPFQYSCLESSMDRGAWQATVHEVAKNWTQLSTNAYGERNKGIYGV